MPTQLRANLEDVLVLIQQQLIKYLPLPGPECCYFVSMDEPEPAHPQAEQYVTIAVGDLRPDRGILLGAGRSDARVYQDVEVRAWNRCALDEAGKANVWLLDKKRGMLPWRRALLNALLTYMPADGNGNVLALPVRLKGAVKTAQDREEPEWGKVTVSLEIEYEENVDQSRIA